MARNGSGGEIYEMAAHLLLAETPFSRNRNYEAFNDPKFARALALYRRLRALLSDLERAAKDGTRVVVTEEPRRMRLDFHSPRYARTAFIDRPAWHVLMLHPRTTEWLGASARNPASSTSSSSSKSSGRAA